MDNTATTETLQSSRPWIAIRTFYAQQHRVARFLDANNIVNFIPQRIIDCIPEKEGNVYKTKAVVNNLVFMQTTCKKTEIQKILKECPFPYMIYSNPGTAGKWAFIPNDEMTDLRSFCDKQLQQFVIISTQNADDIIGKNVIVTNGPMKGLKGKIIRRNHKYFVLRSFGNLTFLFTVSRWCCKYI